jgi:diguanylate cyclase (GGDEF)-like protein
MNISPSSLLVIFAATTIANVLIFVAFSARERAMRARRMAAVEGMLASSYLDPGSGGAWHMPIQDPGVVDVGGVEADATTAEQQSLSLADPIDEAGWVDGPGAAVTPPTPEVGADSVDASVAPLATVPPLRGRDPLTGLLDTLAFEDVLTHEDARGQRYRRSATVVVFELDGLGRLVDRLGADAGERIEPALADTISRLARRADYVARLGAGRYAVLLPETDEIAAINYVERIRRACDLWLETGAIAMRLAIGWANTNGDAPLASVMRTATERMRVELRRNGRPAGEPTDKPADGEATGF